MVAKKFSLKYPPFTFTAFKSFEEVSVFMKQLVKALEDIRGTVGRIVNSHASDLDGITLAGLGIANHDNITVSLAGEVNMTSQPGFLAFNSATDSNVTGNGALATVDYDTEVFDQNDDFVNDRLTAPVAGRYLLSVAIRVSGLVSATSLRVLLTTSNRTYTIEWSNPPDGGFTAEITVLADMDAADTAVVNLRVAGMAGDTVDIEGVATNPRTFFSGHLEM